MGRLSLGDRPHGYWVEFEPGSDSVAKKIERDTYRCQHCGFQVRHMHKMQPRAICKRCMGDVCEKCAPRGACHPQTNPNYMELLEKLEREDARRSYG